MKILIAEDQVKTAQFLLKGLSENGHGCEIAQDGLEALYFCSEQKFDCIILDIQLPKLDGWSVLASVRANDAYTPVLILTAQSDIDAKVKGLEAGADDYLVKPFAFSELVARIHAITRRKSQKITPVVQVADLKIDLAQSKVMRAGRQIQLTAQEFALLRLFAENVGQPLSRTIICEKVWGLFFDSGSNVVDVAIRRLREKIDRPFGRRLLHTIRGIGYQLSEAECHA